MNSALPMAILIGIVALLLIGFFLMLWKKDKDRSHSVSDDSGRFPGTSHGHRSSGR